MKNPLNKLVIGLLSTIFIFSPIITLADEFNPQFIISDEEMQDWQSMNRGDIQAFLESYPGILKSLMTYNKNGEQKIASDIILQAAEEYRINPKYILVKLQKEQSLITSATPTQKQLDGAAGYGISDSCGWTCTTYLNNQGFGKQVDAAAGIIRWYYDNLNTQSWIKRVSQSYTIDGIMINPLSLATAFLYTYTPHLQGNKNFWTLYQKWFQQIFPDGTLVKTTSSPMVYLIQNGKKQAFQNLPALVTRYNPKNIIITNDSELSRYSDGTIISLPNYSILKNNNSYYLLDNDIIRPFASPETVTKMGYQPEEIIEVTSNDLVNLKTGSTISLNDKNPLGQVVKLKENGNYYFVKDSTYYPIINKTLLQTNFSNFTPENISAKELSQMRLGETIRFKDGTLVGEKTFNKIYVIEKGLKRNISNEDIFNSLGYDWNNIVWVDLFTLENYDNGQPLYARVSTSASSSTIEETYETVIGETGKMITTPEEKTTYLGKKFDTNIDAYLVADYKTGKILAGKNIDVVRPIASFTKVMTGYRLIKEGLNLSKSSTFKNSDKAVYHKFRIVVGEKIKNSDLLKSMLVSSVNTAAKILADQLGTEQKFVKNMNTQVKTWGLKHTAFKDSYGYDLGNISTAREFLTIFNKALGYKTLLTTMGLEDYSYSEVLDKDGKPRHFDTNSNLLVSKTDLSFNILAGKTGYLDEAGAGLTMLVERPKDKKKFVIITMGNPDYTHRFDEPENLTEWALTSF